MALEPLRLQWWHSSPQPRADWINQIGSGHAPKQIAGPVFGRIASTLMDAFVQRAMGRRALEAYGHRPGRGDGAPRSSGRTV